MHIKKDFTIQKVGNSYVAVAVGETSKNFHGMVRLNETGAFLWKLMAEKDCTEEELVEAILAEYEVDRETVVRDVRRIVSTLNENHIFTENITELNETGAFSWKLMAEKDCTEDFTEE